MKKRCAFLLAILFIVVAFAACAPATVVTVANEQLNFVKMDLVKGYAGISPSQGNQILTVKFMPQSESPDLTKISDAFFGQTPSTLSNGTNSYPCKSIAFEKDTDKLIVTLVFDVPADFKTSAAKFSLSGSEFKTIELNV